MQTCEGPLYFLHYYKPFICVGRCLSFSVHVLVQYTVKESEFFSCSIVKDVSDPPYHKVRTYKEYHSVCPSSELGLPPQSLTRRLVCHLPPVSGGRGTLAGEKGVGRVPIPTRGIHCGTLYMYVLCAPYHGGGGVCCANCIGG
jgi:hypothetical protein